MKRAFSFKIIILLAILIGLFLNVKEVHAQLRGDTIIIDQPEEAHSPRKATLYSTFLPGLGQVYNKKYWYIKVPIIYGGFGALIYSASWNNTEMKRFKKAYKDFPDNEFEGIPQDQLIDYIDYYRRYRDLSVIGMVIVWGLNVIEANVSGHFYNYDISPDLSLKVEPFFRNNPIAPPELGIKLAINF
ncbi:MAG: hypothetical protein K9H64_04935 [Bacteroidales bacterium]|nr:hypothetical protein [Bacteroidales bacterium]MCF8455182.1 hypothetical protein [Bacteroidales bacterium]